MARLCEHQRGWSSHCASCILDVLDGEVEPNENKGTASTAFQISANECGKPLEKKGDCGPEGDKDQFNPFTLITITLAMLLPSLVAAGLVGSATAVTLYSQVAFTGTRTHTAPIPSFTPNQTAAYDSTVLIPPAPPNPPQANTFNIALQATNASVPGLSIMQHGSFYGFSVEMSVITRLCM